jgi:zinc transporter ZupT
VTTPANRTATRLWLWALLPLLLLGLLVWAIVGLDPARSLGSGAPPVEVLAFQRVTLAEDGIRATVMNDGPDPVVIAQVQVDEAYWTFEQTPPGPLGHLEQATLHIPYPWVDGEAHEIRLVTRTGVTFDHAIEVAIETPRPSARFFGLFALIGLYVGVIPVGLGLLWYPMVGRLGRQALDFVLALTVGLLLFLFVDTLDDGLEAARELAASLQGVVLFLGVVALSYLAIELLGGWLRGHSPASRAAWVTALTVAVGIGLHNFGEGLAIGAAFSLGEVTLGTLLIVGFTLHNTTEGLAIVAPLAESPTGLRDLVLLGVVAGAPTILGGWIGAFTYSRLWSVAFLAIGAGALAQVSVQILRGTAGERALSDFLITRPVLTGLAAGMAVMYATGMLVG